ncbi:NUDIX hydrolase [Candidatus Woesearchaeota archaeon]|nr:NUDIX hydrolase [Candidatus Woesearchaeota archaeon]
MKTVAALCVKEETGKILVLKRNNEPFKGKWCLPGGHVDPGEDIEKALERELKEETNLDIKEKRFLKQEKENFRDIKWEAILYIFRCKIEGEVKLNHEHEDFRWIGKSDLDNFEFAFNHKKIIEEVL